MPVDGGHEILLGLEALTGPVHSGWWKQKASMVLERWGSLFLVKAIGSPF